MTDVINFTKTAFTWSVVALTILWSVGAASLAAPVAANAAECPALEAGDFVRSYDAPDVYVIDENMALHYMDNGMVAASWPQYSSSAVNYVETSCLGAYTFATTQPGVGYATGLVKQPINPAVYYIALDGTLYYVPSEAVAAALFGANWASLVRDIVPAFAINYGGFNTVAGDLSTDMLPENSLVMYNDAYWVYMDGAVYPVDGTLPQYHMDRAIRATDAMLSGVEVMTDSVTALESLDILRNTDAGDSNGGGNGSETPVTGGVTISLAASTAEATVVPLGAQGVEFMTFNVKAGSTDARLEQITVRRGGIGTKDAFTKVYLYSNGMRVDNGRSLNTDDEATFNVNMTVKAGMTQSFTVRADMETNTDYSGDMNYFEIRTASAVESAGTVSGSFPVRGNSISLGNQAIGTVEVEAQGSDSTAKIGEEEVVIGEFDLTATNDDITLLALTLKQRGSAPTDFLENIELKQGGTMVGTGSVSGDYIMFEMEEGFLVEDGQTKRFKVYADLGITDSGDTVQLILDESSDLEASSADFGSFNAGVTNTSLNTANALEVEVEGGKINVDIDGSNDEVRVDQNDVVFGTFSILATAEDLDIDSLEFELNKANGDICLEDLRIRDKNGKGSYTLEDTDTCATGDTSTTYTAENLTLNQGTTYEFEIVGDIAATAAEDDAYYFTWAASAVDGEGVSSDNTLSADDFSSGNLTGPTMTVSPSSLTVRSVAISTSETVVNGADKVLVFRGTLEAGSTSDIEVTSVTVGEGPNDDDDWGNLVDSMYLYVGGVQVDSDNTVSGEAALFDGLSINVPAGSANKVSFEIYADITDGSTTGDIQVQIEDMDATDEDGDTVSPVDSDGDELTDDELESPRTVTVAGTGSLTAVIDTNYTGLRNDMYVLAGTDKQLVGRVQLKATNEDVLLKDLVVFATSTASTSTLESTFGELMVYSDAAMTTLLTSEDFTKGNITLEDVDFTVPADETKYLYLGVSVQSIGTADDGTATASTSVTMRLEDTGTTAEGLSSKSDLASGDVTATEGTFTKAFEVVGSQITSVASSFANGNLVGGEQVFFNFSVTANSGDNTDASGDSLDAYLTRLNLQLSTDVGSSTSTENVSAIKLCRLSTGNCIDLNTVGTLSGTTTTVALQTGTDGYVDVTDFTSADDERVSNGETVMYELRATFSNTTDNYAQGSVQDVDNGGIVWGYDVDSNSSAGLDYIHTDLKRGEPRPSGYPDVTGGSLN